MKVSKGCRKKLFDRFGSPDRPKKHGTVSSRSAFLAAAPGSTPAAYPEVVFGPTGGDVYVVSRAGIYSGFAPEASLMVFEPSLAGREVAVMREAIFQAGAGAVAKVAGT